MQFSSINKESEGKKRLIRNKMRIENSKERHFAK